MPYLVQQIHGVPMHVLRSEYYKVLFVVRGKYVHLSARIFAIPAIAMATVEKTDMDRHVWRAGSR